MSKKLENMNKEELKEYIYSQKKKYGGKLVIPAHHYQTMDIIPFADFIGDSYKLAVDCSKVKAEYIVFCGVRFMAEGASILSTENQKILIPDIMAGCPMADMIDEKTANQVFNKISDVSNQPVIPIVYMNSYADMKSFCGQKGGAVCTSSNAVKIVKHYLDQGQSIFFFPDFNLGINTAEELKIAMSEVVQVKRDGSLMGFENQTDFSNAKMFVWDGFCHVHKEFTPADVHFVRKKNPHMKIIVHPECDKSVVELSDLNGSTQKIYEAIKKSPTHSQWAVGTELNFVKRIAHDFPDKTIIPLRESSCFNMEKITLNNLALTLNSIDAYINQSGKLKNQIEVNQEYRKNAKKALEKMICIVES
ncbi:MAG: quinolinate synthase NadA [Spirochaetes bacterium]|nr:quinolinate synthase NadA [Spirochaetota bacterium]